MENLKEVQPQTIEKLETYFEFCLDYIQTHLSDTLGRSDLQQRIQATPADVTDLICDEIKANATYTHSEEKAKEYIISWWDDLSGAFDFIYGEGVNSGNRPALNLFERPGLFMVGMIEAGVFGILDQTSLADNDFDDDIQLNDEIIRQVLLDLEDICDVNL